MFTNALPWEEDEARAFCWRILLDLTQGASFWNATAERIEVTEEDWLICFHYAIPPAWDEDLYWCTSSADPEPPPIGPGPPPPGWPDDYGSEVTMWAEPFDGISCWDDLPIAGIEFDPDVGPWGGFGTAIDGFGVGDMHLEVYPISWTIFAVTWRYAWEVVGGSTGHRDIDVAPGFFPSVLLEMGEITDCPFVQLLLTTYIPP